MFIDLKTGAETKSIRVNRGTTFQLIGTIGVGESITFEQPDGAGGWASVKIGGSTVVLNADTTIVSIAYPAILRLNKPITVGTVGVQVVS